MASPRDATPSHLLKLLSPEERGERDPDQAPSSSDSEAEDERPARATAKAGSGADASGSLHGKPSSAEIKRSASERSLPIVSIGQMKLIGARSRRNLLSKQQDSAQMQATGSAGDQTIVESGSRGDDAVITPRPRPAGASPSPGSYSNLASAAPEQSQ